MRFLTWFVLLATLSCGHRPTETAVASAKEVRLDAASVDASKQLHQLGRFTVEMPAGAKLVKLEEGDYDEKTDAVFELGEGHLVDLSVKHRGPGQYCARIIQSDVETFHDAHVPGADRLEHVTVDGNAGLLAVGRAEHPAPGIDFFGAARLELCKPDEALLHAQLVLRNREVGAAERAELLAIGASFKRRPVANIPSEQCTEKDVASACVVACEKENDAMSCLKLGHLTYHGDSGVPQDRGAARKLFERVCKAGIEKGCRALDLGRPR